MNVIKEIFQMCDQALFYKYENEKNICDFNRLRKYLLKYFYDKIPENRILISLNIIDNIILKIYNNDTDDMHEIIHKLREEILYMLSFIKTSEEESESESELESEVD